MPITKAFKSHPTWTHGHWRTPLLGQCEVPAQDGYSFSCVPGQGGWCIQGDGKCCQGGSSDCIQRLLINMMCQAASSWCLKFYFPWITSYNCACHSYWCYFWLKRSVTACVEWRTDYTWLCAIWRVSICMHLHMYALTCIIVVHSVFKRHRQLWWTAICTECECGNEWLVCKRWVPLRRGDVRMLLWEPGKLLTHENI